VLQAAVGHAHGAAKPVIKPEGHPAACDGDDHKNAGLLVAIAAYAFYLRDEPRRLYAPAFAAARNAPIPRTWASMPSLIGGQRYHSLMPR
jgi:hypothetical protein